MSSVRPFRLFRTTAFRLATFHSAVLAVSVAILGTVVFWTIEAALSRQASTRIESELAFLQSKYRAQGLAELVEEVQERMDSFVGGARLEYLLVNAKGDRLAGHLQFMPGLGWNDIAIPPDVRNPNGIKMRVLVVDLLDGIRFAIGDDLEMMREIDTATRAALSWILPTFLLMSMCGGALLSHGFLRRVDSITRTAEAIIDGDLNRRISMRGTNDDLDRLSQTLNQMLNRIADLMENLRQVSTDIAHDLRTPLTRLRTKLEEAEALASNPDQTSALQAAIAVTDEILSTFTALLRIAQIEGITRRAGFKKVDLSGIFQNVGHAFGAVAEAEGKVLIQEVQAGLEISGDKELLTQMVANLLDNAIRHTQPECRIELRLSRGETGLIGSIEDNGPGVPAEHRERIFRRFYRLEPSRTTPGSGLGLAIVAAIANLHDIKLIVTDRAPGLSIAMKFRVEPLCLHPAEQL
jgi:signal transduction histidine kinase